MMRRLANPIRWGLWSVLALALALPCCDDDSSGSSGGGNGASGGSGATGAGPPVVLDPTEFTYALTEGTAALPLWTTPCTRKVSTADRPPEDRRSGLSLSAARREFEPVQLLLGPAAGTVTVSIEPFPNLGGSQRLELAVASFESNMSEHLTPLASGGSVELDGQAPVPVWLTVQIPADAPAGDHETTLQVTPSGGSAIAVPIKLRVFDFALPETVHYASQLNVNVSGLIPSGGAVDDAKTLLFEHRFTPKSVTWPSGFRWGITWDNSASSSPCEILWDEPDEPDQYSIGWLAPRYMLGTGWNGIGFPNAMLFQFVDNSTPRPDELCGISRGDHYGTPAFNAEWSQYLGALEQYLVTHGLLERSYVYVQNEPQDEEDHQLAAHLCRLYKAAAPSLRIAVSEEPKPEIAEDPGGACGYDIWIAHIRAYEQNYAWQRQQNHGEQVWLYSLDHDPDPYFNPTLVTNQGIHQRIIPWVSFKLRATGWAYYAGDIFFDGPLPTVRAEILREGFEDYEYLYLANDRTGGGAYPEVFIDAPADVTVSSVTSGLTSWTRNPDALMALRHELGLYIEGSRDTLPVLAAETPGHPRDSYYLNFQDPDGQPAADPLEVDGATYLKIGWLAYDADQGLGWYGEYIDDPGIAKYGYDDASGYDEHQRSYVYDDYGRDNLFEFALENGRYEVTVGAGRPGSGYPNDPHHVSIEGNPVIDDEPTSSDAPTIERTVIVDLVDGSLSVEMGGKSATTGQWSYTFLAYLEIVPVEE